jgi:disulfide bond formation protein DsbB
MLPTPRQTNALIVALCVIAMLIVYYLDGVLGLEPCPLCVTQRVFVVGAGFFALAALAHGPGVLGRRIYAAISGVFAIAGGSIATRHVWLQHLPEDQVPACGPSLDYMLEHFPFSQTLKLVLMGDGDCAEVLWTFAGLSIPEQSLLLFTLLVAANAWQILRRDLPPGAE